MADDVKIADGVTVLEDGVMNIMAGLGAANPKTASTTYAVNECSGAEVEAAYRTSPWFKKIVDIRAQDSVRMWRAWQADNDVVEVLEKEEKRLNVRGAVLKALKWQRLYGGSAIMPLGLPGLSDQEVRLDSIGKGTITGFVVLSKEQLRAEGMIRDPRSPYFGKPERYSISDENGGQIFIHPSRLSVFTTRDVASETTSMQHWGDSLWVSLADHVNPVDMSAAALAALMIEAKVDVMRVSDLHEKTKTAAGESALMRRFRLANMVKSMTSTIIADTADEWEQKSISWGGLPEVVMTKLNMLAGASSYPVTRLLGVQAKGLNNGGDIDTRNYYDDVKSSQELELTPAMYLIDECIIRSATGGRDPSIWYNWNSLWQMSDKERAEIGKMEAETVEKIINSNIIPEPALALAVRTRLIESGAWPGLEQALEDFDAGRLDVPETDEPDETPDEEVTA